MCVRACVYFVTLSVYFAVRAAGRAADVACLVAKPSARIHRVNLGDGIMYAYAYGQLYVLIHHRLLVALPKENAK